MAYLYPRCGRDAFLFSLTVSHVVQPLLKPCDWHTVIPVLRKYIEFAYFNRVLLRIPALRPRLHRFYDSRMLVDSLKSD